MSKPLILDCRRWLLTAAAVLVALSSTSAQTPRSFNIPSQDLASALEIFAKQADKEVLFDLEQTRGKHSIPIKGALDPVAALRTLMGENGLAIRQLNERTFVVGTRHEENAGVVASEEGTMRLVQGQSNTAAVTAIQSPQQDGAANVELGRIEEVVVTAQRREERLQEVPISMSVLRGTELDSSTVRDVTEALNRVPGVAISESFLGGFSQVPVRGVATQLSFDTGSNPTAYYLDHVPFGFANDAITPDADAYDLERVEVLRGPQGTLYGANALNGVVRVITKDANPNAFELKARGFMSSTEKGGENYRGDMAINVPLIEGKLAARAALGYQDLSGWIDRPADIDANDAERRTARLKLNAQPTEQLSIGLSGWWSRADYGAPSTGSEQMTSSITVEELTVADYDVYGLKMGYQFPGVTLTSTTGYLEYANNYQLALGETADFRLDGILAAKTFAQEFYLASTRDGAWRWTAGGMYRDSQDRDIGILTAFFPEPQTVRNVSESYAVFGELTRLLQGGKWALTFGLRYFEDSLTQFEDSSWLFGTEPDLLVTSDDTFNATTPRAVLTWHPSEQMTLYASYGEGFRSGYHQLPVVFIAAPFESVKPDSLTNYELGAKGTVWDRRINFEVALYYIDWQDIQQNTRAFINDEITQVVGINGESASGLGMDFGLTVTPTDALELGLNFSWNDLGMDADVFSGGELLFYEGDRPNNSAEYTAGASAAYSFPFGGSGLRGRFSASANYTSPLTNRDGGPPPIINEGDGMLIARANFAVRAPAHWVATLYADNINNENGSSMQLTGRDRDVRIRPRTIGLQVEYSF